MAYQTSKIKDLSIALEALSRINHPAAGNMFEAIESLLDTAITRARKEAHDEYLAERTPEEVQADDIPF